MDVGFVHNILWADKHGDHQWEKKVKTRSAPELTSTYNQYTNVTDGKFKRIIKSWWGSVSYISSYCACLSVASVHERTAGTQVWRPQWYIKLICLDCNMTGSNQGYLPWGAKSRAIVWWEFILVAEEDAFRKLQTFALQVFQLHLICLDLPFILLEKKTRKHKTLGKIFLCWVSK